MNSHTKYCLFPYCFIVKGKERNIIYDSQFKKIIFLPIDIIEIIEQIGTLTPSEICDKKNISEQELHNIFFYLQENSIIFAKNQIDTFYPLNTEFYSSEHISHIVWEYSDKYEINDLVISSINKLCVKYLEIRITDEIDVEIFSNNYLKYIFNSTLKSVQIISDIVNIKKIDKILDEEYAKKILNVIYYNSTFEKIERKSNRTKVFKKCNYKYIKEFNNEYDKNIILDLSYFTKAQHYNPYYYARLCISKEGDIMNCLKNKQKFGNVLKDNLFDVINKREFKEFWYAKPDNILEIKDNPLRYNMFLTNDLNKLSNDLFEIIN